MTTTICEYCKNTVSKQNMRRHQKTETCKKFQVPVLSDFDKEIMRLCEENEKEVNSDYESDSDKSSESEYCWGYCESGAIRFKSFLKKYAIEEGLCVKEEEEEE